MKRGWSLWALAIATLVSTWLTATHLRVSSDLSTLFPDSPAAAALARYTRAFGGGDLAAVLLRGADPDEVENAAGALRDALRTRQSVLRVLERAPVPRPSDPTLAWIYAGPSARTALARALTPEGMRQRLDGTRDLLLAPGSSGIEDWLARDPLRLSLIPWEDRAELAAGVASGADGAFTADRGRARLVLAEPKGGAFDAGAAKSFVRDAEYAIAQTHRAHPSVSMELTGGHAIARGTEVMLVRDLTMSGSLSLVLASAVFVATFRRARALLAVLPPLMLGTLWTTGLASLAPGGLNAIAIAFTAVVVGVGVDTGVHVYAALLEARRAGAAPNEAASLARRRTWRPTLLAAVAAAVAFASLALSELRAMRQLGILCAAGELLTAVAILLATPAIGAYLERGNPPPRHDPWWLRGVSWATATRRRAWVALACACAPVLLLAALGPPRASDAILAIRPRALAPLVTQDAIYRLFGGKPGQWVVLSIDGDRERAAARADAVAEHLDSLAREGTIEGYDALAPFAPALATQRLRLSARDALNLPSLREALAAALADRGFDPAACTGALEAFSQPSHALVSLPEAPEGAAAWLFARHLARQDGDTLAATYVRPRGTPEADARALAATAAADPDAVVTGYPQLEAALRAALARDLPRIALVALVLVALALRAVLGRASDVVIALVTLVSEIALVMLGMRAFSLGWHVYDALVLPVLLGVTIDESMFLLHAARGGATAEDAVGRALAQQGPLVASTALTTAAGFAALLACRFEGLFDLGAVGALGAVLGLIAALVVVPAGVRLARSHAGAY